MNESKIRSAAKTLTWRVIAICIGFGAAALFIEDKFTSLKIAVVANMVASVIFYCHERVWDKIKFGRHIKEKHLSSFDGGGSESVKKISEHCGIKDAPEHTGLYSSLSLEEIRELKNKLLEITISEVK